MATSSTVPVPEKVNRLVEVQDELRKCKTSFLEWVAHVHSHDKDILEDANLFYQYSGDENKGKSFGTRIRELEELEKLLLASQNAAQNTAASGPAAEKKEITLNDIPASAWKDRVKNPHQLLKTIGASWPFQYTNDLKKQFCLAFKGNYAAFKNKSIDKSNTQLVLLCDGPGSGKSRTLMEVPSLIESCTKKFKEVFVFNISFENGTVFNPIEETADESAYMARIVFHLLSMKGVEFPVWRKQICINFTLSELLNFLYEKLHQKAAKRNDMVCLLMLDGLQQIEAYETKTSETEIEKTEGTKQKEEEKKGAVEVFLGNYITSLIAKDDIFVFPVVSFTAKLSAVRALRGSNQCKMFLNPPQIHELPPMMTVTEALFEKVKGHGRALEFLMTLKKEYPNAANARLLKLLAEKLVQEYPAVRQNFEDQKKLLLLAWTGKQIIESDTDKEYIWLSQFLVNGFMHIRDECLQLSLLWYLCNTSVWEEGKVNLLDQYDWGRDLDGNAFEDFVIWFRMVVSHLRQETELDLKILHRGIKWLKEPPIKFQNIPLDIRHAAARDGFKKICKGEDIYCTRSRDENEPVLCDLERNIFKACPQAPSPDIFLRLGQEFIEGFQVKHLSSQPIPKKESKFTNWFLNELEKSIVRDSSNEIVAKTVFLFITAGRFPQDWKNWLMKFDLCKECVIGVVDSSNFKDYYNNFADLWLKCDEKNKKEEATKHQNAMKKTKKKRQRNTKEEEKAVTQVKKLKKAKK